MQNGMEWNMEWNMERNDMEYALKTFWWTQ